MRYIGKLEDGKVFDCKSHLISIYRHKLISYSQQKGYTLRLQARIRWSYQRLGYRCGWYVCWWRATIDDSRTSCLRKQGPARYSQQQHPRIRRQVDGDQINLLNRLLSLISYHLRCMLVIPRAARKISFSLVPLCLTVQFRIHSPVRSINCLGFDSHLRHVLYESVCFARVSDLSRSVKLSWLD